MTEKCKHKNEKHLADNGSCTGGYIYWCADCGAISITGDNNRRTWVLPGEWVDEEME